MKFTILSISTLSLFAANISAQIMPGDIAFTLYDSRGSGVEGDPDFEGDDQFAFVALNTIAMGETITFRDADLNPMTLEFNNNAEDELLWTATEEVPAGTIVSFTTNSNPDISPTGNNLTVNVGEVIATDGSRLGLSSNGDSVWAIVGEDTNVPDAILAVISTNNFGGLGADEEGNLLGTGLALGSAFVISLNTTTDEAQYVGLRTGENAIPDYASLIADIAENWLESAVPDNDLIADTTSFVVGGSTPEVTISVNNSSFSESAGLAASQGTVSIPSTQEADVTVQLTFDDFTEVNIPSLVIIPAGSLSASFDIDAVDDPLDDGDRMVTITADAIGFTRGNAVLTVTDDADNPTTALSTGDILFVCFNAANEAFGFVATTDIPAGEIIFFTDEEWDDSIDAFGTGERDITWTAPAEGLVAGEVVIISNLNESGPIITGGGTVIEDGATGLNAAGETLYAYQGVAARQPVTFLAAIANHTDDSILNTGLTPGVDALFLDDGADYGEYTAFRSGQATIADYAPIIADISSNWTQIIDNEDTGEANTLVCDDTDFIIGGIASITIVDSGFIGDDFFIEVAEGTAGLLVTSSDTLDFANSSSVNATVDSSNSNRFLISLSERNALRDFFRIEAQ